MRLMINTNVYGWIMWGILGKDAKWFLGFTKEPKPINISQK